MRRYTGLLIYVLVLFLLLLLPLMVERRYFFHILTLSCIYAIFAISWNLLAGYVGELSLGHALFFGLGAYSSALLNTVAGMPAWGAFAFAIVITTVSGALVGIPCLRLKGPYLSIVTLAMSMVLFTITNSWLGGEEGIKRIRPLVVGTLPNYYLSITFAVITVIATAFLIHSRIGLLFQAIRENSVTAESVGVDVKRYKLIGYLFSAAFAGMAGALQAHFQSIVTPDSLSLGLSFAGITMTAIGGIGTLSGPVVGALGITILFDQLSFLVEYRLLIYSVLLVIILRFAPGGLMGLLMWSRPYVAGSEPVETQMANKLEVREP
jgi:branched-chain amino acid transport system permease protein